MVPLVAMTFQNPFCATSRMDAPANAGNVTTENGDPVAPLLIKLEVVTTCAAAVWDVRTNSIPLSPSEGAPSVWAPAVSFARNAMVG